MPKVFVMPLMPFTYAREGVPELFEPGKDENGEAVVFEFEQHQAENCERRGWGKIVDVRRVVHVEPQPGIDPEPDASNLVDVPSVNRADMQMRVVVDNGSGGGGEQPSASNPQQPPEPAEKPAGGKGGKKSK